MAFSGLFSTATGAKRLCKLDIRPESDFVFLRGAIGETPDFKIGGHVVVMNSETIQTKGIRLVLRGRRRTMHFSVTSEKERLHGTSGSTHIVNKSTFYHQEIKLGQNGQGVGSLKSGNHEFPFEFIVPGDISETVEGLPQNFIIYELKAVIERGIMAKDVVATRRLRFIRTLAEDSTELMDPQVVDGTWPDKIKYTLSTSSRAFIFGDKIITDVELTPLLEKLQIGNIKVSLLETRKIRTVPGPIDLPERTGGMWRTEMEVAKTTIRVPDGSEDINEQLQLPMHKFRTSLPLPKSLLKCRQSIDRNEWIRIKHQLHFDIMLLNPDGHVSQLKAHHAVRLFISPNLPVGGNNEVSTHITSADTGGSLLGELRAAPPNYGNHQLDPLYEDVENELGGCQTPFSGSATPRYTSRRRSSSTDLVGQSSQMPQELNARLRAIAEIRQSNSTCLEVPRNNLSSAGTSRAPTTQSSRSNSVFDATAIGRQQNALGFRERTADEHSLFNMDELKRLPSFDTAKDTPLPRRHESEAPPTYEYCISRPPSPSRPPSISS